MAYLYTTEIHTPGSSYGYYKGYLSYSTSETDTSYTITLSDMGEVWRSTGSSSSTYSTSYTGTVSGSVGSYFTRTASKGTRSATMSSSTGSKYISFGSSSGSQTIAKTTSAQTVVISFTWKPQNSTAYTASKTITIPAKAQDVRYIYYKKDPAEDTTITNMPSTQSFVYGQGIVTLSSKVPTRSGYVFKEWYIPSISGSHYQPGQSWSNKNSTYTLYTRWDYATYTITYNLNGGTGTAPASQPKNYGTPIVVQNIEEGTEKTGYDFLGWASESNAAAATWKPGDNLTAEGNRTLYAVWKLKTYLVTYNGNKPGSAAADVEGVPGNQTKKYGEDLTLIPSTPTLEGYTFKTWNTLQNPTTLNPGELYSPGQTYTSNNSLSLYAQWKKNHGNPTISNVVCKRITEVVNNGVTSYAPADDGELFQLTFNCTFDLTGAAGTNRNFVITYATSALAPSTISFDDLIENGDYQSSISSDTEIGTVNIISKKYWPSKTFSANSAHNFTIRIEEVFEEDSYAAATTTYLSRAFFILDFGSEGYTIGIGKAAADLTNLSPANARLDIDIPAYFLNSIEIPTPTENAQAATKEYVDTLAADYIVNTGTQQRTGTSGSITWRYTLYKSGKAEAFGTYTNTSQHAAATNQWNGFYRYNISTLNLPNRFTWSNIDAVTMGYAHCSTGIAIPSCRTISTTKIENIEIDSSFAGPCEAGALSFSIRVEGTYQTS